MNKVALEMEQIHLETVKRLPFAVALFDPEFRFAGASDVLIKLFGLSGQTILGQHFYDVLPSLNEFWEKVHTDCLTGISHRNHETQIKTMQGEIVWLRWSCSPWYVNDSENAGSIIYFEDVTSRKLANESLKEKYSIEQLLTEISGAVVNSNLEQFDDMINYTISRLGEYCKVDRTYVFFFNKSENTMSNTHEWCADGISEERINLQHISCGDMPSFIKKLVKLQPVYIPDIAQLPPSWKKEKAIFEAQNIKTALVVPLLYKDELIGFAGFDSVREKRNWTDSDTILLQLFANRLTTLMEKKRMELKLKANNEELEGLLSALPDIIFKIDKNGIIKSCRAGVSAKFYSEPSTFLNKKVTDVLPSYAGRKVFKGIQDALANNRKVLIEYPLNFDGEETFFETHVNPVNEEEAIAVVRDISHRKHIENMLKINRELLTQTGKMAKIGGWEHDLKTGASLWTDEMYNIYDLDSNTEITEDTRLKYYKSDDRSRLEIVWDKLLSEGVPFDIQAQITTAKKKKKWVHAIGRPKKSNGKIKSVFGTLQDITAQKESELIASQSMDELENFFNVSLDLFFIADMQGNLIKVNNAWTEILGYTKRQLKRRKFLEFVHSQDMQPTLETISQLIDNYKILNFVNRFRAFDGSYRYMEWRAQAQGDLIYAAARDVTERKIAEENLLKEKLRLESIIAATNIGTWEWNIQTGKLHYNKRWAEILGYELEELQPVTIETFKDLAHPEDLEMSNELVNRCIQGEIGFYSYELRLRHKSGRWIWVSDRGKVVSWTEEGQPLIMLGTHVDITDRKKSEEEKIATLNIISEQNKRLLNFTHIVSHNLRSHSGNFSMLLQLMDSEPSEEGRKEMLEMLRTASAQLTETVHNLNEVVAVNTNVNERKQHQNLYKAIDNTKKNILALIRQHNVKVENLVDKDVTVNVVPAYLDSILLNLFTNAIKYRSPDRQAHIKFYLKNKLDHTVLHIEDNGLGIDLKRHGHKLFGMYKTFHGNKDARGVGLFISKNQMEAMGGQIDVESTPNEGTIFKLNFNAGS